MSQYESEDDLGFSIAVLVVLHLVVPVGSNGMPVVVGDLFISFPTDFPVLLVFSNHIN
jgi:hypothetical protein